MMPAEKLDSTILAQRRTPPDDARLWQNIEGRGYLGRAPTRADAPDHRERPAQEFGAVKAVVDCYAEMAAAHIWGASRMGAIIKFNSMPAAAAAAP